VGHPWAATRGFPGFRSAFTGSEFPFSGDRVLATGTDRALPAEHPRDPHAVLATYETLGP
jgi:hypothetical protein